MRAWEKNIRKVTPYVPGEQPNRPGMIKLNTNENPYPPAPGVEKALREFDTDLLRRYPDSTSAELVEALADTYALDPSEFFVGVGSDDVLSIAFMTFFQSDKPIVFPDITYSFYDVWAEVHRIPYERKALDERFRIRREDYYPANGGVIFPNPNAPTGVGETREMICDILDHNQDVVVIIDEAYVDFGKCSVLPLIKKYENLLVVQTFSKARSMAGMRIGYAMGHADLIKAMNDVKYSVNSYTMNQTAIRLGRVALEDPAYLKETVEKVVKTREHTKERLHQLGFSFEDSQANFVFVTHKEKPADEIFQKLREKNIYVRHFNAPRIHNYLRISIGTDAEMEQLFVAMEEILRL